MNCPNCGAALKIENNKKICEYCGYEELLPPGSVPGNDDFYNLMVFNESSTPDDIMVKLAESDLGFIIRSGEAVAKDVPPGYHTMVVTCGNMTEYRSIVAPGDGKAVKVYVARGAFGLSIRVSEPGIPDRATGIFAGASGSSPMTNPNTLPIMALVFSFLFPFIGIIFAIIDAVNSKKQGRKLSILTIIAFCLVGARILLGVILLMIGVLANLH
ncbi:MAG: zinc ribbon domain-containing protein [Lachnospiraceae bacterium]|nr:zinc ribbon domain-containing protein [Lachnospiraceae bacterium]